jgi:hypothetical protein
MKMCFGSVDKSILKSFPGTACSETQIRNDSIFTHKAKKIRQFFEVFLKSLFESTVLLREIGILSRKIRDSVFVFCRPRDKFANQFGRADQPLYI